MESYKVPYNDWYNRFQKYSVDEIKQICKTLSEGDQVIVNKRETTLRVRGVEDCRDMTAKLGDTGYALNLGPDGWCVHLEGNGTRYEIHVPEEETSQARLVWPSDYNCIGYMDVVVDGEVYEPEIRSSVTASDILGDDLL